MAIVVAYDFVTRTPRAGLSVGSATAVLLSPDVFALAYSTASGGTVAAIGVSAGAGAASGNGEAVTESIGASDGFGDATASAEVPFAADGLADGIGTASGVGEASGIVNADGLAQGIGDAPGVGVGLFFADGQSSGTGDAPAEGAQLFPSQGSSDGAGSATGDGASVGAGAGVGYAQGTGTATGAGLSVGRFAASGLAQGIGVALGVGGSGSYFLAIGQAYGHGSAAAEIIVVRGAIGAAVGTGIAAAVAVGGGYSWPTAFLGAPILLADGYSHRRADASTRTEMDSGFNRARLTTRNPLRTVSGVLWLDDGQLEYFRAWSAYRSRGGETWFYIDLPIDGPPRTVQARLRGDSEVKSVAPSKWSVTLSLECVDANAMTRAQLDAQVPDDGTFPADLAVAPVRRSSWSSGQGEIATAGGGEGVIRLRDRTRPFRTTALTWRFTDQQLKLFHAWHEYRAHYDASFFDIDLWSDGSVRTVRARFSSQPTVSYVGKNLWECSAEIIYRDISITRSEFAVLELISLEDLQAINSALENLSLDPFFDAWDLLGGSTGRASGLGSASAVGVAA